MRKLIKGTAAAALFLALPFAANAQEQEAEACVAEVSPVHAGQVVEVWGMFPAPFGEVTAIEAPEESGLILATAEDVEMVEMAAEEADEEKAALANDENTSIFWLDTRNATAGTYTITLKREGGSCVAEITVEDPA